MNEFLITVAISFSLWLVVKIVSVIQKRRLMSKMPSEKELSEYIQELKDIRATGGGYQVQKQCLLQKGVHEKVAESILALIEKEEL